MPELKPVFDAFPVLETERCLLRAIQTEDASAILRLFGSPEVNRYLGRPPMASLEEATRRTEMFQRNFAEQSGLVWAITLRDQSELIGNVLLWNLSKPHFRAELGYSLMPEWWGHGVITEVVTAVIGFAFNAMGLHSLQAVIDPNNQASRRVLEKQGFVQEGYFREDYYDPTIDQFTDLAVLSLLYGNWTLKSA